MNRPYTRYDRMATPRYEPTPGSPNWHRKRAGLKPFVPLPTRINTRESLLGVPNGTLMVDKHGYPMTRTHEGEFALWSPDEDKWKYYSVGEIDGTLVHGGESNFFPIACIDAEVQDD